MLSAVFTDLPVWVGVIGVFWSTGSYIFGSTWCDWLAWGDATHQTKPFSKGSQMRRGLVVIKRLHQRGSRCRELRGGVNRCRRGTKDFKHMLELSQSQRTSKGVEHRQESVGVIASGWQARNSCPWANKPDRNPGVLLPDDSASGQPWSFTD